MQIKVIIKKKKIRLSLWSEGKEQDYKDILDEHSLSEIMLKEIDNLLKRNKMTSLEIEEMKVISDQTDNFTTTRIAKTVANTWNWTTKKMRG
jgi:hypothetical protein